MGARSSHTPSRHTKADTVERTVHRFSKVHQGGVNCISPAPSRHTIITGGADGNATIFNFNSGKVISYMRHGDRPITAVQSAGAIDAVVTGCRDTKVRLWQGSTATVFSGHSLVVTAVAITPDSDRILSGSRDNCINAWDVRTAKLLYSISESRNLITALKLIPNEHVLVQTSEDKRVRLWDTRNLQLIHVYPTKHYIQTSCDVSADGNYIVSGSNGFSGSGCEISLWDVRAQRLVCELRGHTQGVNTVKFLHDSSVVVSGSQDSLVKIWDVTRRECVLEKRLPGMGAVTDLVTYPDSSIVCATSGGCVLLTQTDPGCVTETICF